MLKTLFIWLNEHFNLLRKVSNLSGMDSNEEWLPCQTAVDNAQINDLKLIFAEAEHRLDETIKSKEMYYQRSNALLGICLTILTTVVAYLGSKLQGFNLSIVNLDLIAILIIMTVVSVKSKNNLLPVYFDVNGTFPKNIFKDKYLYSKVQDENEKALLVALIKDYQCRISDNISKNTTAAKNYRDCIDILYYTPLSVLLLSILGALFHLPAI